MILYYKGININIQNITLKKRINYSNDFIFIPMKYNNKDILIQTPVLYSPFGMNTLYNCIDLSFQYNDITNYFINNCLNIFYNFINTKYSNSSIIEHYIRNNKYSKWMRFKVTKDTIFFNQDKQRIETFDSKVSGSFIIHLSGIWIIKGKVSFNWVILQAKIYNPIILKEYSFIEEEDELNNKKKLPPLPPPLPPPAPPLPSSITIKKNIKHNKKGDLKNIIKIDKVRNVPDLDEIMNALKKLNKVN